ncbi:MAG: carboxynorspermidine decarboxylase [bacterium]
MTREIIEKVPTPCYVVDEVAVERNLKILRSVKERTGCKILLALKGFAMFSLFPLIRQYLDGTAASSVHEARLGREELGGEVHAYAPAFSEEQVKELTRCADHIIFNSFSQWRRFKETAKNVQCGLRVNPGYGKAPRKIYNPCGKYSRMGIPFDQFRFDELDSISGLHFHALCEQNAAPLEKTLKEVEKKFQPAFSKIKWMNFGGGHHITRPDYDVDKLCELITRFKKKHGLEIYLEPGEAIALRTGALVSSVLDIIHNDMNIAILDTSAAAHMPDVLEMPYRPIITDAAEPNVLPHTYRLGGPTCLAGDIICDYSFSKPLQTGDRLVFEDMAHYTMVKNNTFNGIALPSIAIANTSNNTVRVVKQFDYEDYRNKLS